MNVLDEAKRNHLRMLLEARKTTTARGLEETMKGKWNATTIIELTIMSKRILHIPTTTIITKTIVTVHGVTEIQGAGKRRSVGESLMGAMNIQDAWRATAIRRDAIIRMKTWDETVTVAELSNNEYNGPHQYVE